MKPKTVKYSYSFFKGLKRFPKNQLKFLSKQETIFRSNIFDPRLKTHKLKGELKEFYAFSISYHWRIVFHLEDEDTVVFDLIETHQVYR
ncbi:type II toxin-antitoxin system RelE/ParE family toxin [Candidatus Daviesbacteria bacterium]|nr:type II toxin-antitoxin system RelE/ParE family toxin [Candidatus Daviesbacteria bacterium]